MAKIFGTLEKADLESLAANPSTLTPGRVYYNSVTGEVRFSNGAAFKSVSDTDSAQSLSNKSLTTPILSTHMVVTDVSTPPATPAAGTAFFYRKSDGKFYQKNSVSAETEVGGGGGGSPNALNWDVVNGTNPTWEDLYVVGNYTMTGTKTYRNVFVTGILTLEATLTVTGNLVCGSVTGTAGGSFQVTGDFVCNVFTSSQLTINANCVVNGSLRVRSAFQLRTISTTGYTLTVHGDVTTTTGIFGAQSISDGFISITIFCDLVCGAIQMATSASTMGSITVYGNITASSINTVSASGGVNAGSVICNGNVTLFGSITMTGTTGVSAGGGAGGTLTVRGNIFSQSGSITMSGGLPGTGGRAGAGGTITCNGLVKCISITAQGGGSSATQLAGNGGVISLNAGAFITGTLTVGAGSMAAYAGAETATAISQGQVNIRGDFTGGAITLGNIVTSTTRHATAFFCEFTCTGDVVLSGAFRNSMGSSGGYGAGGSPGTYPVVQGNFRCLDFTIDAGTSTNATAGFSSPITGTIRIGGNLTVVQTMSINGYSFPTGSSFAGGASAEIEVDGSMRVGNLVINGGTGISGGNAGFINCKASLSCNGIVVTGGTAGSGAVGGWLGFTSNGSCAIYTLDIITGAGTNSNTVCVLRPIGHFSIGAIGATGHKMNNVNWYSNQSTIGSIASTAGSFGLGTAQSPGKIDTNYFNIPGRLVVGIAGDVWYTRG